MTKVRIVFPSLFQLWDFKQVFRESVLQTICRKRSLVCLCSEALIELAVYAYEADVFPLTSKANEGKTTPLIPRNDFGWPI